MALGNNPSFTQVRAFFSGPANLAAYVRGGAYVPNIAANAAISTTVAGLKLSQFSGADKVVLPPVPYNTDGSCTATHFDAGAATAEIYIRTNGTVASRENGGTFFTLFTWLPSGRSASEYQYRTSPNGTTWSGWVALSADRLVASATAYSDGFYSDDQYDYVYMQIGAQGTALSAVGAFDCHAQAIGRG